MGKIEKGIDLNEGFDFDKAFLNRENIDFFGNDLEIIDIKPEVLKTEVPVLIAPGWGETIDTFKDSIRVLVEDGRRVLSLNHPRDGKDIDDIDPDLEVLGPKEELRKALALLEVLNQRVSDKADVIAHSEGGINTAIAASLQSEKFRTVAFTNAGGIMGYDDLPSLAGRYTRSTMNEALDALMTEDSERRDRIHRNLSEAFKYIAANPIRAVKESVAISSTQVDGVLGYLHEVGVGVIVVGGKDDPIFPIEKVEEMLNKKHIDSYITMPGGHNEISSDPEAYMKAIEKEIEEYGRSHQ